GKGPRLRDRPGIVLDWPPVRLAATLRTERADRVDRLRREPDMAHDRNAALDQKGDRLGHAAPALKLDRSAAGLLQHPCRRHESLLLGGFVGAERHVDNDESLLRSAHHPE